MSNYTKCRWIAVGGWVEVEDDNIPDICTCDPEDMGQDYLERSEQEIMANARLIATAPLLLEAAKKIMENLDGMAGEVTSGYHENIIAPLRNAIAQAEGV